MKTRTVLVSVFIFFVASAAGAGDPTVTSKVLWMADEPQCFDPKKGFPELIEDVDRFTVGGPVNEPKKISGETPSAEELKATGETPTFMVFEMVINPEGKVELVVSLRPRFPKTEALVAGHFRDWEFESAIGPDGPICIRYIMTYRICY
jgi:hypothetical protein